MSRKKIEVVELNKKENKILLQKKDNWFILLLKRHDFWFYLFLIILGILFISLSIFYAIWKIKTSDTPKIALANEKIEVNFSDEIDGLIFDNILPVTEGYAENEIMKNNKFISKGEILVIKKVESGSYIIYYFSDGYALKVSKDNNILRIGPLEDGGYGIKDTGEIDINSTTSVVTIKKIVTTDYGTITYYSDGSALITDSIMDMFVRKGTDIHEKYISDNKVSYLKNEEKVGNNTLKYFYDGTMLITNSGYEYIIRNSEDISIKDDNIEFPNNNKATVTSVKKLENNIKVTYYSDGGATISNGSNIISVRKSNSIIIRDNKLIEIIDNDLVEISYKNGNTTYYTNGSATTRYNGEMVYVPDNSDIKYNLDGSINHIDNDYYSQDSDKQLGDKHVSVYDDYTIIEGENEIKIVPTDSVMYDSLGHVKEIEPSEDEIKNKDITIRNNTNDKINYRVILEKSNNTTLDTQYIRGMLMYNLEYIGPFKLNDKLLKDDNINKQLGIDKTNYVLLDTSLEAYQMDKINLSLWTDYDTIPNEMMNKVFLGTIKIYAYVIEE